MKAASALLAGLFIFADISAAAVRAGLGEKAARGACLSAPLRSNPLAAIERGDGGTGAVSEDPRHISDLAGDTRKKAGIRYISSLIIRMLEQFGSGQTPESIVKVVASHVGSFHGEIDLSGIRWKEISKKGEVFTLRYEDEGLRERELLYSLGPDGRVEVRPGGTLHASGREAPFSAAPPAVKPEEAAERIVLSAAQGLEFSGEGQKGPGEMKADAGRTRSPEGASIEAYKIRNSSLIGFVTGLAIMLLYPYLPPVEAFVIGTAYILTAGVLPVMASRYINDRLSYRYHRKEHGLIRPFRRAENIRDLYDHDPDSREKISYYSYSTEKLYAEKAALRRIPKYVQYVIYFHEFVHGRLRVRTELVALSLTFCAPWAAAGAGLTAAALFFMPADAVFLAAFTAWNAALPAGAYMISRPVGVERSLAGHNLLSGLKWKSLSEREIDEAIIAAVRKRTYSPDSGRMEYWRDWLRGSPEEKNVEFIRVQGRPEDIVVVKEAYDPARDGESLRKAVRKSRKRTITAVIADDGTGSEASRARFSKILRQAEGFTRAPGARARTVKADIRSARHDIRRLRDLRRFYRRRLDRIKYGNVAREAVASEVHGQVERLRKLLDWLGGKNMKHILFLGDYLGKKENGYEAIDMLKEHVSSGALPRLTMLMGKSEHLFLRAVLGDEKFRDAWPGLPVMEGPAVMMSLSRLAANAERLLALFPEKGRLKDITPEEIAYMRELTPARLEELKALPGAGKPIYGAVSREDLEYLQKASDREIGDIIEADAFERAIAASITGRGGEISAETLAEERKRFYRFHPKIISLADFMAEHMRFVYSENSHHNLFLIGSFPEDLERRGLKGIEALEDMEMEFRNRTKCGLRLLKLISEMWIIARVPPEGEGKKAKLEELELKMLSMVREEKARNREIGVELIPGEILDSIESDLGEAIYDLAAEQAVPGADTGSDMDSVFSSVLEHVAAVNRGLPDIYETVFRSEGSPFMAPVPHGMEAARKGEDALYERRMALGVDAVSTPADFTRGFQTLRQVRVFTRSGRAVLYDVDTLEREYPVFEETLAARAEEEIVEGRSLETITRKKLESVEDILLRYESLLPGHRPARSGKRRPGISDLLRSLRERARRAIIPVREALREILQGIEWTGRPQGRIARVSELLSFAAAEYRDMMDHYREGFEMLARGNHDGLIILEQVFASEMTSPRQREKIMNEILAHMKLNEDETARETAFEVFEEILSTTSSPGFEKHMKRLYSSAMDRIYPRLARVGSSGNEKKYRMYIHRHITNALMRNRAFRDHLTEDIGSRTDPREKNIALSLLEEAGKRSVLKDLLDLKIGLRYSASFYEDITSREVFQRAYGSDVEKYCGDIERNLRLPGSYPSLAYLDILEYLEHPATTNLRRHAWAVDTLRRELPRLVAEKSALEDENDRVITFWDLGSGSLTPVLFAAAVLEEFDRHPEWGGMGERVSVRIRAVDIDAGVGTAMNNILENGIPHGAEDTIFRKGKDPREIKEIAELHAMADSADYRQRIRDSGMIEFIRGSMADEENILSKAAPGPGEDARGADMVYMSYSLWQLEPAARQKVLRKLEGLPERSRVLIRLHGDIINDVLSDIPSSFSVSEPGDAYTYTGCRYILKKKPRGGETPEAGSHAKSDLLGKDVKVGDTSAARRARKNAVFNITAGSRGMESFIAASDEALLLMRSLLKEKKCRIKISGDFGRLAIRDGGYVWMDQWLFDIRDESEFLPKLTIFTALLAHQVEHSPGTGSSESEFQEEVRACAAEIRVYVNAIRAHPGIEKKIRSLLAGHFDLDRITCDDVLDLARGLGQDTEYYTSGGEFTAAGIYRISGFVAKHYDRFRERRAGRRPGTDEQGEPEAFGEDPWGVSTDRLREAIRDSRGMLLDPGRILSQGSAASSDGAVWSLPLQSFPGEMAENILSRQEKLGAALSGMKDPPHYLVNELFENARALRSRMKAFIERYYGGAHSEKPAVEMCEAFLRTVETDLSSIERRTDDILKYYRRKTRKKTYIAPARQSIPESEANAGAKFIDTLAYHIFQKALQAGHDGEKIIIGLDTSWIPEEQASAIQGLLNRLSHISRKKGMANIIIRRRKDAAQLAECLITEKDKHGAPLSNIIIFGGENIVQNRVFDPLRGSAGQKGAFFAAVRLPEGFSEHSYIRVLEMIGVAVDLAFDKRVIGTDHPHLKFFPDEKAGYRLYIFIPDSTPFDLITLNEIYRLQRSQIDTRA